MHSRQNLRTGVPSVSPSLATRSMRVVKRGKRLCRFVPKPPISDLILAPVCSKNDESRGLSRTWRRDWRSSSKGADRSPKRRILQDDIPPRGVSMLDLEYRFELMFVSKAASHFSPRPLLFMLEAAYLLHSLLGTRTFVSPPGRINCGILLARLTVSRT